MTLFDQERTAPLVDMADPYHQPTLPVPVDSEGNPKYSTMRQYRELINKDPRASWVKVNKYSDNAKYLPIRIVEELLGEMFPAWEAVQVGQPQILGNSIVISVNLRVFHPIMGQWLQYPGIGAVPIELEKGADPTDFTKVKPKAIHKNAPAALSFAINNAAKKLGRLFGSHLNSNETMY